VAQTQQPMQRTSWFCNVSSLVLLNPEFLFALNYIHSEQLFASYCLFGEESNYKCITGTSRIPQYSLRSFDIIPYLLNAAESAVVDRFCTADLLGPTVKNIPCLYHLTYTAQIRPSVALTSWPTKSFATTVTTSNAAERRAHKHNAQDIPLMWSSCVMRYIYQYWHPRKIFVLLLA
jgi:hypothetical protein